MSLIELDVFGDQEMLWIIGIVVIVLLIFFVWLLFNWDATNSLMDLVGLDGVLADGKDIVNVDIN